MSKCVILTGPLLYINQKKKVAAEIVGNIASVTKNTKNSLRKFEALSKGQLMFCRFRQ